MRIFYILYLLGKYGFIYYATKFGLYKKSTPKLLRNFFEDAGGAFVKFGQILSLRVDALPESYALEMLELFDNVKPFPYADVEELFLQQLGAKPEKLFKDFQKKPFASASFAQVHAAKLSDDTIVAVKIMRPGIETQVTADFLFIDILAFFADIFFKIEALPWKEFAKEFKNWTKQELDYHIEAANAELMYKNLTNNPTVVIPKIYRQFTTRKILVEEYIEGIPLSRVFQGLKNGKLDAKKLKKYGVDITKIPRILTSELLREFFIDGLFHADPHPGNILLLPHDKICLIDFGIMGDSRIYNSESFVKTIHAWSYMDFKNSTYHFANFVGNDLRTIIASALPATVSEQQIQSFIALLADYFSEHVKKIVMGNLTNLEQMKKDYSVIFLEIINASRKYRVKLPSETVAFLRALSIIGFLTKQLDISFKITEETKAFFNRYPEETLLQYTQPQSYQRISYEKAVEQLNDWLSYLVEVDPTLYQLVKKQISQYTNQ